MDPEKTLFVFVSHVHYDHYNPDILKLRRQRQNIWYLFSDDVPMPDEQKQVIRLSPKEERRVNGIRVRTLPSTDEGVAFWIEYQGIVIYHAGDLNWWHWEGEPKSYNEQMRADYQKAIGELPDQPIDGFPRLVRQTIAAACAERPQTRKVRASQGRMPDNVRWR